MIAQLVGVMAGRDGAHVIVDCNGVGYDVVCSQFTLASLPADGERVALRVFTHAQENKIALYGFGDAAERALFDLLITVKNVGPSTAIAILSGSSPREISELIAREDVAGLVRIKGVGKKTAELLVVELHEKCAELLLRWDAGNVLRPQARVATRKSTGNPVVDEVRLALVGMGWSPNEAESAVVDLPITPDATIEVLLRHALRAMPR